MTLLFDAPVLHVADLAESTKFLSAVFGGPAVGDATDGDLRLDLGSAGHVRFRGGAASGSPGFRGVVLSVIFDQPADVAAFIAAAASAGADVLKPGKKSLFAGFSGVIAAPDGTIWKAATATRKDSGPAAVLPRPTDLVVLLGVSEPKRSKAFATARGLVVDRDYGNKYLDFTPGPAAPRLAYMTFGDLAKDAGAAPSATAAPGAGLVFTTSSADEADRVVEGGREGRESGGARNDEFADPDGFVWRIDVGARP